jgi:hypothetical protein
MRLVGAVLCEGREGGREGRKSLLATKCEERQPPG